MTSKTPQGPEPSESIYDLVIIGSGPGGYVAAVKAAQLGLRTACIEKDKTLGGTCLNVGCIPSKALLESSHHLVYAREKFAKHGLLGADALKVDLPTMMKHKEATVRQLTNGVQFLFKKNKVDRYEGYGSFVSVTGDLKTISVEGADGKKEIQAKNVIIATGSVPVELPFLKYDGKRVVDSTGAIAFEETPKHLLVIGGGVIGLELGSVWSRLGAKVTVVEFLDRICPSMDTQIAKEFQKILTKQGIEFRLSTKCLGAKTKGEWVLVEVEDSRTGEKSQIECDRVLVSVGRKPYTDKLGLDKIGVNTDDRGRVAIDAHFRTSVPGIYAIGDVVVGPMLAHKAEDEGMACAEIIAGQKGHVNYDAIPSIVYTAPEVASVGKTEEELKSAGIEYKVGTFPFGVNGRSKAMMETEGMVKILSDKRTDRILGAHILGAHAGDLIHELVVAMEFGGSAEDIARTCHAHPTLSEIVREAAIAAIGPTLHM